MRFQAFLKFITCLGLVLIPHLSSQAIIVFQDPGRLTTMPTLGGGVQPGWQYLGQYGSFTGIPIGPRAWVTANHVVGGSTGVLNYNNAGTTGTISYTSTFAGNSGDLAVMTLNSDQPSFTSWATVWSNPNTLVANHVYMFGRGTARGSVVTNDTPTPNTEKGWNWGTNDGVQSYGTNNIDGFAVDGSNNYYLAMSFTKPTLANGLPDTEGIYSSGDSGSGVFSYNTTDGKWELVGVNYAVDVASATSGGSNMQAALYDMSGFYSGTTLITSAAPAYSYATSVANKYSFLAPFIAVPEPSTWILTTVGTIGMLLMWRRKH